jgi:hypothetical protein
VVAADRLQQIFGCVQLAFDELGQRFTGHDDGRDILQLRVVPLLLAESASIHHRHVEVEEHDPDLGILAELLQTVGSVFGNDYIEPGALQGPAKQGTHDRFVVDDEHASGFRFCRRE